MFISHHTSSRSSVCNRRDSTGRGSIISSEPSFRLPSSAFHFLTMQFKSHNKHKAFHHHELRGTLPEAMPLAVVGNPSLTVRDPPSIILGRSAETTSTSTSGQYVSAYASGPSTSLIIGISVAYAVCLCPHIQSN